MLIKNFISFNSIGTNRCHYYFLGLFSHSSEFETVST